MKLLNQLFAAAVLTALAPASGMAGQAQIAVAANFSEPIKAIATVLEKTTRHTVRVTLGATGKLYAQIKNGAPFDVLLAANAEVPQTLEKEGLAAAGSSFIYANGKLVLWSANPSLVDARGEVLKGTGFRKLAYANPKTAPYGDAALQTIDQLGLSSALAPKLVQGESIGQAFNFVFTGNAELGFVALSQVLEHGKLKSGSIWLVPQTLYKPIEQKAVLLQRGASNPAALALVKLLQRPATKDLIRSYGYDI
ncbi:MAG: molybdate ABC transporter substrate-binding protein [Rhodoferax sp.]|nr:molybdate ABC transporter substrate-binding protein [Rhodoferax sp.]